MPRLKCLSTLESIKIGDQPIWLKADTARPGHIADIDQNAPIRCD